MITEIQTENIPPELKDAQCWVNWTHPPPEGEPPKVPKNPRTGGNAVTGQPRTWASLEEALSAIPRYGFSGVGFMFDGNGLLGIDLDKCRNPETGAISGWAQKIVEEMDTYTEVSPSGTGLHLLAQVSNGFEISGNRKGSFEAYVKDRYFTVTGDVLPGHEKICERTAPARQLCERMLGTKDEPSKTARTPSQSSGNIDIRERLEKARRSANGDKFRRLYDDGDFSGHPSQSEADLALCSTLSFWLDNAPALVDQAFRESALIREKWDRQTGDQTYGEMTIARACEGCAEIYQPKRPKPPAAGIPQKPGLSVDPWECVNAEQDGDAKIFIDIHRNRFVFDHSPGKWFEFTGHHWKQDRRDEALAAIESVVQVYLKEAEAWAKAKHKAASIQDKDQMRYAEKREKKYLNKVSSLRKTYWKQAVLQLAVAGANSLGLTGDEWDTQPWLLGVKNGVVDLQDGSFRSGKVDDYIRTVAPTAWKGIEERAPGWEKFLTDIFDGDQTLVQYMQRLCGYALIGETPEHIFPILYGPGGRNGKGTFLQTLATVLGPYSGPIQSEMLLREKFARSSAAPSPDIMSLRGRRIVWASEINQGRNLDTGRLKWLCGGDTLVGRPPHGKQEIEFAPSHTLFLLTNNRPQVEAEDDAVWERISLIPFTLRFVDDPQEKRDRKRDRDLPKKLKEENTGILAWMVRGCLQWQRDGLNPPEKVKAATTEYRDEEDDLGRFIEERCRVGGAEKAKAGELYKAYKVWSEEMGSHPVWQNRFGQYMRQRFDITSKSRHGRYYIGLTLEVVS